MNSFFSEAQRADDNTLLSQIDIITENPVMTGLLHSISGLLAIMNEHRQIIALNDSIMEMLGIDNPSEMLGLRLGEVVKCVHAEEEPAECGTTRYCSTCGAAIAIASSLTQDRSIERICALSAKKLVA